MPWTAEPTALDRGLATHDSQLVADQTVAAWDDFLAVAEGADLDGPSRLKKTSARAVVAKVGDWPQSRQLPEILADAAAGVLGRIDQDAVDELVLATHGNSPAAEVLAAVARARNSVAEWAAGTLPDQEPFNEICLQEVGSPLGPLPVITYVHAAAFQLAVSARDLRQAGANVPDSLEFAGLRALVDTTGALAARMNIESAFAVITPVGAVFTVSANGGWIAGDIDPDIARENLPGIEGGIGTVLDVAAGRKNPIRRMHKRELVIRDAPSLLRLAPIAQENPGLPGGPLLRKAAAFLSVFGK